MMNSRSLPRLSAISLAMIGSTLANQRFSYSTSMVTTCTDGPAASITTKTVEPPAYTVIDIGTMVVNMPQCHACGCATCVHTSVFTTHYPLFCPTGYTEQHYTVTEVYTGMEEFPTLLVPTTVPYAFTTGVVTCNICGVDPVVATMTYPATDSPYQSGMNPGSDSGPAANGGSGSWAEVDNSGAEVDNSGAEVDNSGAGSGSDTGSTVPGSGPIVNGGSQDSPVFPGMGSDAGQEVQHVQSSAARKFQDQNSRSHLLQAAAAISLVFLVC